MFRCPSKSRLSTWTPYIHTMDSQVYLNWTPNPQTHTQTHIRAPVGLISTRCCDGWSTSRQRLSSGHSVAVLSALWFEADCRAAKNWRGDWRNCTVEIDQLQIATLGECILTTSAFSISIYVKLWSATIDSCRLYECCPRALWRTVNSILTTLATNQMHHSPLRTRQSKVNKICDSTGHCIPPDNTFSFERNQPLLIIFNLSLSLRWGMSGTTACLS